MWTRSTAGWLWRRCAMENNFKEEILSGDFALNLRNRTLMKRGVPIELTQVEFQIMEYFFSNPGRGPGPDGYFEACVGRGLLSAKRKLWTSISAACA